jgi:hypothetical protein
LEQGLDVTRVLHQAMGKRVPWRSIIEFATSETYCNQSLYPRQQTLLRLIYLETERMTQYDRDVIDEWREGFTSDLAVCGVQPDIWERIEYLKHRGYRRFPHIQLVLGRRGSKGLIGALLAVEMIARLIALDNPQKVYNIREGKDVFLNVGATSQTQAQRHQFADIRDIVEACAWLQPYIAETKDHQLRLRTPADVRRIAQRKAEGIPIEHLMASIWVVALSASSVAARGATAFANYFDEFAFHVQGSGSIKSGEEIYEDWSPSLGQFKQEALTYVPSSPFCLSPMTQVLTEDLRWVPVGSLQVGDRLIGFDEFVPGGKGRGRTWQPAVVTETSTIQAPRYVITMANGKKLVCTGEHLWLSRRSQYDPTWVKTTALKPGDKIKAMGVDPWDEDESRDAGYLAGFFDGEGYLAKTLDLGYTQNFGPVQARVEHLLKERHFEVSTWVERQERLARSRIAGGITERLRFLGTVRPERLLASFPEKFYGSRIYGNRKTGLSEDVVVTVRQVEDGPVTALGTSTNTLVAEGLLSHNTKVGKFFELYQQGRVLMGSYQSSQLAIEARQEIRNLHAQTDLDEVELKADPTMLILQGPSWMLYEDWERGAELTGFQAPFPPEDDLSSEVQQRRQIHNPEKFAVERLGQFAEVMGAYLDKHKVAAMFKPVRWREPEFLEPTAFGRLDHTYRIHVDPSVTGANFALCIGHTELAPCDRCGAVTLDPEPHECTLATCWKDEAGNRGMHWPHVMIDRLKVWRAIDFEKNPDTQRHEIDYTIVERELDEILYHFPSTTKFSADQWNSVGFLQRLRNKYAPAIRVIEETATAGTNWSRAEKFKSAINLGWVHSYRDHFYGDGESLLEMECNFLSEKNGKVYKQEFGPVQTKDLYDAVSVVVTDLLHTALERWERSRLTAHTIGSSNVPGLRSGREFDRLAAMIGSPSTYRRGHHGSGRRSWEELDNYNLARRRGAQRDPYYATRSRLRDITERNKN